jgi:LysR family hydrogen peroxide-inducible transcriptional activator
LRYNLYNEKNSRSGSIFPMTRQPTLKQVRYLVAVSELSHFGKAAAACHVSQSTLSSGIAELEDVLGVPLVERNNRAVILTLLGEEVVRRGRSILMDVEDMRSLCDTSAEPFAGKLRLGVIPTIAPFILPGLLNRMRGEHPGFKLFIREDLSGNLVELLQHGELDALLLALPFPAERVETKTLFEDEFMFACPKNHPLAAAQALKVEQLKGEELLLLEDGHCLREHALEACRLKEAQVSVPYQATTLNTIVQMVANGIGITVLPKMAIAANLLRGTDVQVRPFDAQGVSRMIGLMWRKQSPRRNEFQLLGDFIQEAANGIFTDAEFSVDEFRKKM